MTGTGVNEVEISCVFTFSLCEDKDSGFCIFKYRDRDRDKEFVAVGHMLPKQKNLPYKLYGFWESSKKSAKPRFKVQGYEVDHPTGQKEVVAYFMSLKCGIGRIKANAIYRAFGDKTWDILDNEPEKLKKIVGVSEKVYTKLMKTIAADNVTRNVLSLLQRAEINVTGTTLRKLVQRLGPEAVSDLTKNPYIAYGVEGFSFDKCDSLGSYLNIPLDFPMRLRAFVVKVLNDAALSGHVCLPKQDLLNEVIRQSTCQKQPCMDAINALFKEKGVIGANGMLYLPKNYSTEESICNNIMRLMACDKGKITGLDGIIDDYEKANFKLADMQREAIKMVFSSQVSVITGGPGVGKTTVTNAILYTHREVYGVESNPLLLAPTGKAARRMSEATNYPAATIHSAVGWRGDDAEVECSDEMLNGNLILVDESSMVDQKIASILLEHIEDGTRVVFIGDIDQLPSVGCGNVLRDMIASGVVPTTRLTVIYRQAGTNPIVANAHAINEGKSDLVLARSFKFIEANSEGDAFEKACRLYMRCVRSYGVDNVVLLNPQRNNTDLSVDNFNIELQKLLNPPAENKFEIKVGKAVFRENDRVMELKNTENAKNGDVGIIRSVVRQPDPDEPTEWIYYANIEFNDDGNILQYTLEDLRHVTHAWCSTVHKMQGSQCDTIIQIVSKAHPSMLKRKLIYTGITRAVKNVALIGEQDALKIAVANDKEDVRHTLLAERLRTAAKAG